MGGAGGGMRVATVSTGTHTEFEARGGFYAHPSPYILNFVDQHGLANSPQEVLSRWVDFSLGSSASA